MQQASGSGYNSPPATAAVQCPSFLFFLSLLSFCIFYILCFICPFTLSLFVQFLTYSLALSSTFRIKKKLEAYILAKMKRHLSDSDTENCDLDDYEDCSRYGILKLTTNSVMILHLFLLFLVPKCESRCPARSVAG